MPQAASIAEEARLIAEDFALFDEWRDKLLYVIDLGKKLPPYPPELKTEANKVRGCQSNVWMTVSCDESGKLRIRAVSDALFVSGLIGLLLRLYDNRTPEEILANPPAVFSEIGLGANITPTRRNGLEGMVRRIRQEAEQYRKQ